VKPDLQRSIDRALEPDRTRLADKEKVREFLKNCNEDQLDFLRTIFNGASWQCETSHPRPNVPELSPMTTRGTPRLRSWGVLFPAVARIIGTMDEISSPKIHDALKSDNFKFTTNRSVSSIAAILRRLESEGVIKESPSWKKNTRPVVYKKEPNAARKLAQMLAPNNTPNRPGSLTGEVKSLISKIDGGFTSVGIVDALKRRGFEFDTDSPGASVNGVLARLQKREEIKVIDKSKFPYEYERAARWRNGTASMT
jgi:hypothetical protein